MSGTGKFRCAHQAVDSSDVAGRLSITTRSQKVIAGLQHEVCASKVVRVIEDRC